MASFVAWCSILLVPDIMPKLVVVLEAALSIIPQYVVQIRLSCFASMIITLHKNWSFPLRISLVKQKILMENFIFLRSVREELYFRFAKGKPKILQIDMFEEKDWKLKVLHWFLKQSTLHVKLVKIQSFMKNNGLGVYTEFNPLSANPTKWSNTLKQFVGKLPMPISKSVYC